MHTRLTLLIIFVCSANIYAQQNDYQLFTTREGLPHDHVLSVMQDSYGFIWLGTYDGLCMYDGQGFKYYPEVFRDEQSSWSDVVTVLFEDKRKRIWIGSWNGYVSYYDRFEQSFVTITTKHHDESKVNCIYEDSNGKIWLGFDDGCIGYVSDNKLQYISVCKNKVWAIAQINKEHLYVLANHGLYKYDIEKRSVEKIEEYHSKILYNVINDKNCFYTIDEIGFTKIELGVKIKEKCISPLHNAKRSIVYDKIYISNTGNVNVANGECVYIYSKDMLLIDSFDISHSLVHDKNRIVNNVIEDYSGIAWLASTTGVLKVDKHKKQFGSYSINNSASKLTHNYVRALLIDRANNLWVGFRSGKINKLKFDKSRQDYCCISTFDLNVKNPILRSLYITNTFLETKIGKVLFGGEQGVFYQNYEGSFKNILPSSASDTIIQVWSIYEDEKGNIWIGTKDQGLFIYNPNNDSICNYRNNISNSRTLSDNSIWKIFEDKTGRIWIGTDNGLDYLDNSEDVTQLKFKHHSLNRNINCKVWSIVQDKKENIWIGTTESGVYKVSNDLSVTTHLDNLEERTISALIVDNFNNLWISTINGLYKYSEAVNTLVYFTDNDGLVTNDFNFNASAINQNGNIFLGTKKGIVTFIPGNVTSRNELDHTVRISDLEVSGKNYTGKIYKDSIFYLSYDQNDIAIDLALTDYTKHNRQFRYKLHNHDTGWNYLKTNQNRVTYTNIPPGSYKFIAEAYDGNGNWKYPVRLTINIQPAIWQTLWFKLCIAIIFSLVLLAAIRSRFRYVLEKQKEKLLWEKRVATVELDAIRAQMNPHFLFNTINSIQGFILDDKEIEANEYLTRFAKLMRLFLESSKNRFVLLDEEIELIELYLSLEKIRFDDKFDYEIVLNKLPDYSNYKIPSLLIQPFIENAIKHGLVHRSTKGNLQIIIEEANNNFLKVIIDDDGVGREQSKIINAQHQKYHISRGLEMINDRVKTFNFIEDREVNIEIIDKVYPQQGTIVEIYIPIARKNDKP